MAEIDSLSTSYIYSGIKASTTKTQKEKETEKTSGAKKVKFSELIQKSEETNNTEQSLFPPEIQNMTLEEAAVFLRDEVEVAGNNLSSELTIENLMIFKQKIKSFLTYIEKNNYQVTNSTLINRRTRQPLKASPLPVFSNYSIPQHVVTKTSFTVINEKIDELAKDMMAMQKDNIQLLAQINEIKGLIINLLD